MVALSLMLLYVIRKQNPRCLIKNKTPNIEISSKYCKANANKALKPHEIHDHVSLMLEQIYLNQMGRITSCNDYFLSIF